MAASGGSALKDVVLAVAIVGGVLGALWLYTGVWPPMVVVESGSMMHVPCASASVPDFCDAAVGYGKLGTIDPGDMVFVKQVGKRDDVTTFADGNAKGDAGKNYGKPGDVIVYFPFAQTTRTPIIHRALAWVEATGVTDAEACARGDASTVASAEYSVLWRDGSGAWGPQVFTASSGGINLPTLGITRDTARGPTGGPKPCWSGFITKGDNPVTNTFPDQALGSPRGGALPNQPVQVSWVEGKAVGELPWFGLIKLALSGTPNYFCGTAATPYDPACAADASGKVQAVRLLNAYAPGDLWAMLGLSLVVIAVAPLAYDVYVIRGRKAGGKGAEEHRKGSQESGSVADRLRKLLGMQKGTPPSNESPPGGGPPSQGSGAPPAPREPVRFDTVPKK